jgi:hypothetical protein
VVDGVTYGIASKFGGAHSGGGDPAESQHSDAGSDIPGWLEFASRVLLEKFALIRDLNCKDPVYFLDCDMSVALLRQHRSLIGVIRSSACTT